MRSPRRDVFMDAVAAVPAPPQVSVSTRRTRFLLSEEQKEAFDAIAKGKELSSDERKSLFQELSLPATVFALPPLLEDSLKAASKDVHSGSESVSLTSSDVRSLHELLLNTLCVSEAAIKLGSDSEGAPFPKRVQGYIDVARSLLGAGIKDLITWQRDAVLHSWKIPRSKIPAIAWTPLQEEAILHRLSNEQRPALFGRDLRNQLTGGDNPLSKGLSALSSSSRNRITTSSRTPSKNNYRKRNSSTNKEYSTSRPLNQGSFPFRFLFPWASRAGTHPLPLS